ncbi:hypothetical protein SUGI_0141810 [Cryptomeria japonica]|nr:hypothetical protein SUGI_0141810 [Cryptomeria japonica]
MPELPLEYKELNLIEIIANHVGIFLMHDKDFFKNPLKPIRTCALFDMSKELPKHIQLISKFGIWHRQILFETPETSCSYCHIMGHPTSQCMLGLSSKENNHMLNSKCTLHRVSTDQEVNPKPDTLIHNEQKMQATLDP